MKKLITFTSIVGLGLFLAACGSDNSTTSSSSSAAVESESNITIVTTFYPMYEFTKQVVGDSAEVELMIPAGTEPHDYEPSAKDIANIVDADAFVYNSDEFETWVSDISENIDTQQTAVIQAADGIELMEGAEEEEHDHDHETEGSHEEEHSHELDPHVWLSPVLAAQEVENIQAALSEKYPELADTFAENAENYIAELNALDEEYTTALADATERTFVTQHAAFGYLARQYDLTQVAISGISPDEEPSASRLAELKDYVDENGIQYIYFEENASSTVAETLASEANVETLVLNPLESLTTEQLDNGEDYISVMQENLSALQKTIQ